MKRTSTVVFAASALCLLGMSPASAQQWKMFEEEGVSLEYRNAADTESLISVACSPQQSEIFVPLAPGMKKPAQAPSLAVKEGAATNTIKLASAVCGGPTSCSDRPDGDVSTYEARAKGKAMALRVADKATSVDIDAPGAKISAASNPAVFKQFAAACRKLK
jgi:hypothetical protein